MPTRFSHDPIALALAEDIGPGDLTCTYFVAEERQGSVRIFAKEEAVVAGAEIAAAVFRRVDPTTRVTISSGDGSRITSGETVLRAEGSVRSLLTAERVALNFLQRLSGIATMTRRYVDAVAGTNVRILDTRKTTPGLRVLEKEAVVAGGGANHRFGLYDMVVVKDNHLASESNIERLQEAIARLHRDRPWVRVELEADTLDQVRAFLTLRGVHVILLDNMTCEQMSEAVALGAGQVEFEASGGVSLESVARIAATGVDYISAGALTHSARSIDFSLELLG